MGKHVKRTRRTGGAHQTTTTKAPAKKFKGASGGVSSSSSVGKTTKSMQSSAARKSEDKIVEHKIDDIDVYTVATRPDESVSKSSSIRTEKKSVQKGVTVYQKKAPAQINSPGNNIKRSMKKVRELVASILGFSIFFTPDVSEATVRGSEIASQTPMIGYLFGVILATATMLYKPRTTNQPKRQPKDFVVIDISNITEKAQAKTKLNEGLIGRKNIRLVENSIETQAKDRFMAVLKAVMTHNYKGDIEVIDSAGKLLWKKNGNTISGQLTGRWLKEYYLNNSGFKAGNRFFSVRNDLAAMKTSRKIEFEEAPNLLSEIAVMDLATATTPRGSKNPVIPTQNLVNWITQGTGLARTTHGNARRRKYQNVMKEHGPYAEGFKVDGSDHWTKAFQAMQTWLNRDSANIKKLKQTFEYLQRDSVGSLSYEHNAFHLAKLFADGNTKDIDAGLNRLNQFYAKTNGQFQISGATFNVFFESKEGSAAERRSLDSIRLAAQDYIAEGYHFKIEVIPTSKNFSAPTPDYRVEASKNGTRQTFIIEVKSFANLLGSGEKAADYLTFLRSGYNVGKIKNGAPPIAQQIGHGLHQLHDYSGKNSNDMRILEIHVGKKPNTEVLGHLQTFINENPHSIIRIVYPETKKANGIIKTVRTRINLIPAKNSKYDDYGKKSDPFAALDY